MRYELHAKQAALSRTLYVIRLRHGSFRSGVRWINRTVAQRKGNIDREWGHLMHPHPSIPKAWQPPEGRESPREAMMDDRRNSTHYAFPGYMRFWHGKAPPLIGQDKLYTVEPMQREARTATGVEADLGLKMRSSS